MKQAAAGASSGCSLEGPTKCTWAVRWASPYQSGLAALCDLFCVRVLMLDGGGPAPLFSGSGPCSYGHTGQSIAEWNAMIRSSKTRSKKTPQQGPVGGLDLEVGNLLFYKPKNLFAAGSRRTKKKSEI